MSTKKSNLHHIQIPDNLCTDVDCNFIDPLVYANVKRFMNMKTYEAYPRIDTVGKLSGCSKNTVQSSLNRMRGKYLNWYVDPRNKRIYTFKQLHKEFEPFSPDFLDNGDLTPHEKAYLIKLQQFMFKDHTNIGKVSFPTRMLADKLNIPERTIRSYNQSLREKGYLIAMKTSKKDFVTGLPITELVFDLKAIGQSIIWTLKDNKKRIERNNNRLAKLQRDYDILMKNAQAEAKKKIINAEDIQIVL